MNTRREFLSICAAGVTSFTAGCETNQYPEESSITLDLLSTVKKSNSEWKLTVTGYPSGLGGSLSNVVLVAFAYDGDEVCKTKWGDIEIYNMPKQSVTTFCTQFPAIISVTADESPCDNVQLEIQYWIGEAVNPKGDYPTGTINWDSTFQRCNEPLPPERVLNAVSEPDTPSPSPDG